MVDFQCKRRYGWEDFLEIIIEKLKEHKLEDYRKAEQKDEEHRIEEFVSTTRAMAAMGI